MNRNSSMMIGQAAALSAAIVTGISAFSLIWGVMFHTKFDQNLGYTASLLLAISVVILMACFYDRTGERLRIFALLALVSAVIYAPLCMSNYFLQLSIVAFNPLNLSSDVLMAIAFKPGSPTFAIDMLGYGFLCLSTLAAGFVLVEAGDKALRILCFIHGAIAIPTLAAPIISGIFLSPGGQTNDIGSYILLFWCAIFIPIALLFRRHFQEEYAVYRVPA